MGEVGPTSPQSNGGGEVLALVHHGQIADDASPPPLKKAQNPNRAQWKPVHCRNSMKGPRPCQWTGSGSRRSGSPAPGPQPHGSPVGDVAPNTDE